MQLANGTLNIQAVAVELGKQSSGSQPPDVISQARKTPQVRTGSNLTQVVVLFSITED